MDTARTVWVTPHGLRKLQHERGDLVHWLHHLGARLRDSAFNNPSAVMRERQVVAGRLGRLDQLLGEARPVPSGWRHKTDVGLGDTVYLRRRDAVRALRVVKNEAASPHTGDVAVESPLGQALIGHAQGSRVRLITLDGYQTYEILKII